MRATCQILMSFISRCVFQELGILPDKQVKISVVRAHIWHHNLKYELTELMSVFQTAKVTWF